MINKVTAVIMSIITFFSCFGATVFGTIKLDVDFNNIIDEIRPVNGINRLPSYEENNEFNQYLIDANIPSCRIHDVVAADIYRIFPDFSKDPSDPSAYDFKECDKVIATILKNNMDVIIRFGITYQNYPSGAELMKPPTDFEKWARICAGIIRHYNYGWADGFSYDIKYWEIWNEPEDFDKLEDRHFWTGTAEEFYEMFDVTAKYLKEEFPEIKIGGYASVCFSGLNKHFKLKINASDNCKHILEFFKNFLAYAKEHNTPLDFFSWHHYNAIDKCESNIKNIRQYLDEAGYQNTESICDEWNIEWVQNKDIDCMQGAKQTSMLIAFQQQKIDSANYYCAVLPYDDYVLNCDLFYTNGKPTPVYYGFWAFGQLFKMGNQVNINGETGRNVYALAAKDDNEAGLLISNNSSVLKQIKISADGYKIKECYTVNNNNDWVKIDMPSKIKSGTILYITFDKI